MTLPTEFKIENEFPSTTYDQWRSLVERDLKGAPFEKKLVTRTYEGIDIQPLYTATTVKEMRDYHRPAGPTASLTVLCQEYVHPDPHETNRQILQDVSGGAGGIHLRLDAPARRGQSPSASAEAQNSAAGGVVVYSLQDLANCLQDVSFDKLWVSLDAGAAFLPAAALLVALWQQRGIDLSTVQGAFNADPLAYLVEQGQLPTSADEGLALQADLARWTVQNCPHVHAVGVNTSVYHNGGASAAQDLAYSLATAAAYLRNLTAAGLSIDQAATQLQFRIELGTQHFLAIAKLRAARRLWSRLLEACGASAQAATMRIHSRTSNRVLTRRDPYVNILRNTTATFAGLVGGADAVTSVPFDTLVRLPEDASRRLARNTVLILQQEAHVQKVIDPAGGSWFLDSITNELAQTAWTHLQEVERLGGMLEALESGWVADQVAATHTARAKHFATRKQGITGVSEFPNIAEERLEGKTPDVASLRNAAVQRTAPGASTQKVSESEGGKMEALIGQAASGASIAAMAHSLGFHESPVECRLIPARRFAQPYEDMRDATDQWEASHGSRPRVFLANLGSVAHHTARATFAKNFFEAGGFAVATNNGFADAEQASSAFAESGAAIAVICSSDKLYEELVPEVAGKLKAAGARTVVLAGNPGSHEDAWRAAGVDRFIFIKCDVLDTLCDLLSEEGIKSL